MIKNSGMTFWATLKDEDKAKKFRKNYSEEELHDIVDYLYKVFTEANKTESN